MDFRLVIPAVAVWMATIVGLQGGRGPSLAVAVIASLVCVGCVVVVRHSMLGWENVALVVVVSGMVAASAAALFLRQQAIAEHPLTHRDGKATVTMIIRDDPVVVGAGGSRVLVRVDVTAIGTRAVPAAPAEMTAPADAWAGLLPGQRVSTIAAIRPPRHADLSVASLSTAGAPRLVGRPPPHQRIAAHIRERLRDSSARALGPQAAGLLPGLVLGDVSGLDDAVRDDFRAAGLSHLVAVSGANFALVCGAAVLAIMTAGASPRSAAVAGAAVIVVFVILVRPSPSVIRAALMGGVGLLAMVTARRGQSLPALGSAVIVGLLWWPELAIAPGFALSVAATAGLVLWGSGIRDWLRDRRMPAGAAELVAMTLAAQIVTAPVVAMLNGRYVFIGILANLVVVPIVGVIGIIGTLAALIGAIGPDDGLGAVIGELLIRATGPGLWWMTTWAHVCARQTWASVPVPDGVAGLGIVGAATVVAVLVIRRPRDPPSDDAAS